MNRNTNARFELAPQVEIERSTFDMSFDVKTSWNVGELVPLPPIEVLPGDTFEITTSKVVRLQTLITPVMDNLYLDTYYFFVPNRLVWTHWRNLMGENTESAWIPETEYSVPQVVTPDDDGDIFETGTIADYMGIPVDVPDLSFNALPFRAYALIVNEWFRDENLVDPLLIPTGDATQTGSNGSNYLTDCANGGKPFIAAKYHDYFTSALPAPQKGPDVSLLEGLAPIITGNEINFSDLYPNASTVTPSAMTVGKVADGTAPITGTEVKTLGINGKFVDAIGSSTPSSQVAKQAVLPTNLYANLGFTSGMTINYLRQAFQIQRLLERDARSGTRYIELLKAHFQVESPDARLQRPEYLGGNRMPLNIEQVTQTQSTNETSPLGTQAGWSQTNDVSEDVRKSFTEHGFIIPLVCARYDHSYQQGLNRMWTRKGRFDYYWPALAHLGEQAVYQEEIYAAGTGSNPRTTVFGYQEAWSEYKYMPNMITGEMRTTATSNPGLDVWHFADYYSTRPTLSADWIKEDKSNIDRTLAIPSGTANQIFGDILLSIRATRPMPLYSIPGLIDHF